MNINKETKTITMERTFNAPLELVWKAYTEKDLISKWWGPENVTVIIDKLDFTEGGNWRYIHRDNQGAEYAFRGVFKEIVVNKKFTWTFEFEPMAGHILVETMSFEETEGGTKVTSVSVYDTLEDLEGMVATGMEQGANEALDRLEKLLETIK